MTTEEKAEVDAQQYLNKVLDRKTVSPDRYQKALRDATASFTRLHRAADMAERTRAGA
jgi:hypothetical protein